MPDTVSFLDTLRQLRLLEPKQLDQLAGKVQGRDVTPQVLLAKLVERGWLTSYQATQVQHGRAAELVLGSYVLLDKLGEGGMGAVYKARHVNLDRITALKVILKERITSADAVKRFQREIRAAAQLNHPNIVRAFDADEINGTHVLVMEYVEGTDLARLVKQQGPLPVAVACAYVRQAALGLQHAQEKGLVHRDIKPANLLLASGGRQPPVEVNATETNSPTGGLRPPLASGVVKILDFGLARLHSPSTDGGESSGTLTQEGCVMGTPDYIAPEQAMGSHDVDIRADIYSLGCTLYYLLTGKPPFPGGTLGAKLVRHQMDEPEAVEKLRPEVPLAVAAVVRRLMAKKPEQRFQTPAEVAAALGEPGALATGGVPPVADAPGSPGGSLASVATSDTAPELNAPRLQTARRRWLRWNLAGAVLLLALAGLFVFLLTRDTGSTAAVSTHPAPDPPPTELPPGVALSPWALVSEPAPLQGVRGWTITSRNGRGPVQAMAYHPKGLWLATAGHDGVVRLLDPKSKRLVRALVGHSAAIYALAWTEDGQLLASAEGEKVLLWDPESGKLMRSLPTGTWWWQALAWAPRGRTLAVVKSNWTIELWQADAGKQLRVLAGHKGQIRALAWSSDGKTLISGSEDKTVRRWQIETAKPPETLYEHMGQVNAVAWSADGKTLASAGEDGKVRFWRPDAEPVPVPLEACKRRVTELAWSPDGEQLATGGADDGPKYLVKTWTVRTGKLRFQWEQDPYFFQKCLAWAPNGKVVVSVGFGMRFFDTEGGRALPGLGNHFDATGGVAWAANGKRVASFGGETGPPYSIWDAASGEHLGRSNGWNPLVWAWSPDGKTVAGDQEGSRVRVMDVASGKDLQMLKGHTQGPASLAFSPDGKLLASGSNDKSVRVWQLDTGKELHVFTEPTGVVRALAWTPDGKALAAGSADHTTFIWSAETGERIVKLEGPRSGIAALAWSRDGKSLAVGEAGAIWLWENPGQLRKAIDAGPGVVRSLTWLPNGDTLARVCPDGKLRFWDSRGQLRRTVPITAFSGGVFSSDGTRLASGSGAFAVRIWDCDSGRPQGTAVQWRQGTLVLSADGHYSGPSEEVIYVVETEQGQQTLEPDEFAVRFGWKNDPRRAKLSRPSGP